jgi:hypothetical protein
MAKGQSKTAGKVLSELVRRCVTAVLEQGSRAEYRGGFELLPRNGTLVTPERVQDLLDDE